MGDYSAEEASDKIIGLFERHGGSDYIGEGVSQMEHAVQCAMLAETEVGTAEAILGSLLHDIGHLVGMDMGAASMVTDGINLGAQDHDRLGEQFLLGLGLPTALTVFTRGHVNAKRYLTYANSDYYNSLSSASKMTLEHQGGRMDAKEAELFERQESFDTLLKMRTWDERAKVSDMKIEPLSRYRDMLVAYLRVEKTAV